MERIISVFPGVGAAAQIIQQSELPMNDVYMQKPSLAFIRKGHTIIRHDRHERVIHQGEMLVLNGGQTLDVINCLSDEGFYTCDQLIFDEHLIQRFNHSSAASGLSAIDTLAVLTDPAKEFTQAYEDIHRSIMHFPALPPPISRHRMVEQLLWLVQYGMRFSGKEQQSLSKQVRDCLSEDIHKSWAAAEVADHLLMNEVMLRRKLSAENTSLRNIMIDVRMTFALQLLQCTDWSISQIAQNVGYKSGSRFAERFKKRFGFLPTAIRGHQRQ